MSARASAAALLVAASLASGCALFSKPAWEQPPPPIATGPVVPQDRVHRAQLDNGLEVFVLEDHRAPSLEVGLVVRRGAGIEAPEEAGIASFTADLMQRGAGSRDALELARAVEQLGATLSVGSGWDSVTVAMAGLSEDREELLAILEDVVRRPRFEPGEAARSRSEHLAGLEQEKDDPGAVAARHLLAALYPGHRYGIPGDGEARTVAHFDAVAARDFHRRVFTPRDAIFFATGDITPEQALESARRHFGDWQGGEPLEPGAPPPNPSPPATKIVIVDRPDLGQAQLALGHEGIAREDPARVTAGLMNNVLGGGGFLSRLLTRVRASEGLTYSIGSAFSLRRHPGPFVVRTFTRAPEAGRVVGIVLEELERMQTEPPSADELDRMKSFMAGSFVLSLETSSAITGALVELDVYGLPRDSLDTYRGRIRAITTKDTAEAARTLLHPERIAIVAVGPAETLRPLLEPFGPVEVVTP